MSDEDKNIDETANASVGDVVVEEAAVSPTPDEVAATIAEEPVSSVSEEPVSEETKEAALQALVPGAIKASYLKRKLEIVKWEVTSVNDRPYVKIKLSNQTTELVPLEDWK